MNVKAFAVHFYFGGGRNNYSTNQPLRKWKVAQNKCKTEEIKMCVSKHKHKHRKLCKKILFEPLSSRGTGPRGNTCIPARKKTWDEGTFFFDFLDLSIFGGENQKS